MESIRPAPLLKFALTADAVSGVGVTVLHLALLDTLAGLLALPRMLLLESGIFLAGFVLLLTWLARRTVVPRVLVSLVVGVNFCWAGGCAIVLALTEPSMLGVVFVLVHAAAVLLLAVLETIGLKASSRQPYAAAPAAVVPGDRS